MTPLSWLPYGPGRRHQTARERTSTLAIRPAVAIPGVVTTVLVFGCLAAAWGPAQEPRQPVPPSAPSESASSTAPLSPVFAEPVLAWAADIRRWSAEYDVSPDLVAVVMTLESCGDPSARSRAGALGLFQVMPYHFSPGEDPLDPEVNARRGLSYLSRGLQLSGGDPTLALAGYNGGHSLIQRQPASWPAETARYVRWATGILADVQAGLSASPTLEAWLDAGGARLCRQAADRQSS